MKNLVTEQQVKELKIKATGGSARQITNYKMAKNEFESMKSKLFDDEHYPYVSHPDKSYVQKLQEEAEAEGADDISKYRYEIIKSNREDLEARLAGDDGRNFNQKKHYLQQLMGDKEAKVTKADLELARYVAVKESSPENRTRYSLLKRRLKYQE